VSLLLFGQVECSGHPAGENWCWGLPLVKGVSSWIPDTPRENWCWGLPLVKGVSSWITDTPHKSFPLWCAFLKGTSSVSPERVQEDRG
jgi:hypothetical protein